MRRDLIFGVRNRKNSFTYMLMTSAVLFILLLLLQSTGMAATLYPKGYNPEIHCCHQGGCLYGAYP